MSKVRAFTIVFHNVKDDSKSLLENHFRSFGPMQLLIAMEPYPQGEGYHIHVFLSFKNPRSFSKFLTSCQDVSKHIIAPRPEGEVRGWGRVQVDKMRGSFQQATAYLTAPAKDKICDPDIINHKKGILVCDVCATFGTPFTFGADYPCGKLGRCRICCLIPHRQLQTYGFQVRNIEEF